MSTFLKLDLSGYDKKTRFWAFRCEYLLQNPVFLCGKFFGATRHLCGKNETNFDRFFLGGGGCTVSPAGSYSNVAHITSD